MGRTIQSFLPVRLTNISHNALEVRWRNDGRGGRVPYIGKSDRLRRAEDDIRPHVVRIAPEVPLTGVLRETVKLVWPCDATHPRGAARTTKPDADNVVKTLNDVLQECHVIADDAMVADMRVIKMYGEVAGIWLRLEELEVCE